MITSAIPCLLPGMLVQPQSDEALASPFFWDRETSPRLSLSPSLFLAFHREPLSPSSPVEEPGKKNPLKKGRDQKRGWTMAPLHRQSRRTRACGFIMTHSDPCIGVDFDPASGYRDRVGGAIRVQGQGARRAPCQNERRPKPNPEDLAVVPGGSVSLGGGSVDLIHGPWFGTQQG